MLAKISSALRKSTESATSAVDSSVASLPVDGDDFSIVACYDNEVPPPPTNMAPPQLVKNHVGDLFFQRCLQDAMSTAPSVNVKSLDDVMRSRRCLAPIGPTSA